MNYPVVFVLGCFILGLVFPEWIAAINKVGYPIGMNFMSALAFSLIAAGCVL